MILTDAPPEGGDTEGEVGTDVWVKAGVLDGVGVRDGAGGGVEMGVVGTGGAEHPIARERMIADATKVIFKRIFTFTSLPAERCRRKRGMASLLPPISVI